MPRLADHSRRGRRANILRLQRADLIPHRPIHVPHAQVAVRLVEHRTAARLVGRVRLAPMNFDLLPLVAFDQRHAHPDARRALGRIPLFDLIRQRCAGAGGESNVLPACLCLREIKPVLVQSYEQREVLHHSRRRQVSPIRCREDKNRAGMLPGRILGKRRATADGESRKELDEVFRSHDVFRK